MSNEKTSVDAQTVKKIARLSRLHVEEGQLQTVANELNGILSWIEMLGEVDVSNVEPMTSAVDMDAPLRTDVVTDGGVRDKVLHNAPNTESGYFVVPRSVE